MLSWYVFQLVNLGGDVRTYIVLTEYIAWGRFKGLAYPFEIITSNRSINTPTTRIVRIIAHTKNEIHLPKEVLVRRREGQFEYIPLPVAFRDHRFGDSYRHAP
jgi:hypothetical protein